MHRLLASTGKHRATSYNLGAEKIADWNPLLTFYLEPA
jgi:hypothetical protein